MFTLKFVGSDDKELLFTARSVRRDGDALYYTDEHEVEIPILNHERKTAYVMNNNGATVAIYRF